MISDRIIFKLSSSTKVRTKKLPMKTSRVSNDTYAQIMVVLFMTLGPPNKIPVRPMITMSSLLQIMSTVYITENLLELVFMITLVDVVIGGHFAIRWNDIIGDNAVKFTPHHCVAHINHI